MASALRLPPFGSPSKRLDRPYSKSVPSLEGNRRRSLPTIYAPPAPERCTGLHARWRLQHPERCGTLRWRCACVKVVRYWGGCGHSRRRRKATFARAMPAGCALSHLRQSRLAQRVEPGLQVGLAPGQPFDAELGIETASFGQSGLRLVHVAFERVRGGQIEVRVKNLPSRVDRLAAFFDYGVEMTEAEFGVGHVIMPQAYSRIART